MLPAGRFKQLLGGGTKVDEELVSGLRASTLAGSAWVAQGAAVGRQWLEKDAVGETGQWACGRAVVRAGSQRGACGGPAVGRRLRDCSGWWLC